MTFEFIIIHQPRGNEPILGVLRERLREALEANLNDVEEYALAGMVQAAFERTRPGGGEPRALLAFNVELPDETSSMRTVVDEFADSLLASPVEHVVKFEDPLLHKELAARSEELFILELKLRRVLSIIYLHAYETELYNLLREEKMKPQPENNPPDPSDMAAVRENEFFHLTFKQYGALNQRPEIHKAPELKELMRQVGTYEALCAELDRKPVLHGDDAGFLAGLHDLTPVIEAMRNCVAHFRRPNQRLTDRYLNDLPLLHEALDLFLERNRRDWEDSLCTESCWDTETRLAVEAAMESAEWDEESGVLAFQHPEEMRKDETVITSREELVSYLETIAAETFYGHCPKDSGEYLYECDENGVVEGVLTEYEDRLEELFSDDEDGEDNEEEEESEANKP